MENEAYYLINKSWRETCKILLGEEVGDLLEFKNYLKRYTDPIEKRKSSISGKDVTISSDRIRKDAPVIAHDEMFVYQKNILDNPFDIDDIKDIDSILNQVRERAAYTGNIVLGTSKYVIDSHRCVNTFYALECQDVYDGKYVAYTTSIYVPSYAFGCRFGSIIQFCINVMDPYKTTRCMELFHCNVVSDSYYSASLENCTNCIFSFNQRSKNYMIGNVALTKERYTELKKKLLAEMADDLKRKKTLPSVIDIIRGE